MSGRMSTNTGRAPRRTKALTVETKVKDGTITSSPGCDVEQERRHLQRVGARGRQQRRRDAELLAQELAAAARELAVAGDVAARERLLMYRRSWPTKEGRLNGIGAASSRRPEPAARGLQEERAEAGIDVVHGAILDRETGLPHPHAPGSEGRQGRGIEIEARDRRVAVQHRQREVKVPRFRLGEKPALRSVGFAHLDAPFGRALDSDEAQRA